MSVRTWTLKRSQQRADHLVIVGRYDPEFAQAIRDTVPASDREWLGAAKTYSIHESYEDAVLKVIDRHTEVTGPGDLIGIDALDETGSVIGTISAVQSRHGKVSATIDRAPETIADVLAAAGRLGEDTSTRHGEVLDEALSLGMEDAFRRRGNLDPDGLRVVEIEDGDRTRVVIVAVMELM